MSVGKRLLQVISKRKVTNKWVADQVGCSASYITEITKDRVKNPSKHRKAICKALGINEYWMLTGQGSLTPIEYFELGPDKLISSKITAIKFNCLEALKTQDIQIPIKVDDSLSAYYYDKANPFFRKGAVIITHNTIPGGNGFYLFNVNGIATPAVMAQNEWIWFDHNKSDDMLGKVEFILPIETCLL